MRAHQILAACKTINNNQKTATLSSKGLAPLYASNESEVVRRAHAAREMYGAECNMYAPGCYNFVGRRHPFDNTKK